MPVQPVIPKKGSLEECQGNMQWHYFCSAQINITASCNSAMLQLESDPDKECQILRHDVGSSSAETGHSGSNRHQ